MTFEDLIKQAREIRAKYAALEKQKYGREWSGEELTLGFMKDVGDLAKLVQAKEDVRDVENINEHLAHELSDCLWSVIVLADKYDVDLESAFTKSMGELDARIDQEKVA